MKNIILALLISNIVTSTGAQNAVLKAPQNALLVINYSGSALTKHVPLSKINTYDFVKHTLFNALWLDSVSSVAQTCIDFEQDILQYAVMEDSANSFVTILPLQDESDFLALLQTENEPAITTSGAYKTLQLATNKYLGWTSRQAVLVYTTHTRPGYRAERDDYDEADTTIVEVIDSVAVEAIEEAAIEADSIEAGEDIDSTEPSIRD